MKKLLLFSILTFVLFISAVNTTIAANSASYSGTPFTFTTGIAVSPNPSPTYSGTLATSNQFVLTSGSLPSGLSLNTATGVISGTPTATYSGSVIITVNFKTGLPASIPITVNITVNLNPKPVISYTSPQSYTQNVAITSLSPTNVGSAATSYSASSLPAGLSIDPVTGIISGTPTTVSSATAYTITATNAAGSGTFSLTITVNPVAPSITYSPASYTFTVNTPAATSSATNTGGAAATWTSSPTLPAGLAFATDSSGTIFGTPTTLSSATNYTITATNGSGSSSFVITITVANISAYDWTGAVSTDWTVSGNWKYGGSATSFYPGQNATSGSNTNIVRFGVTSNPSKLPALSSTLPNSIASIEIGTSAGNNFTLTLGSGTTGATLPITGNFTLDAGSEKGTLLGTSTSLLSIGGDFYIGSGATFNNGNSSTNSCPITIYGNFTNYSSKVSGFGTALLTFNSGGVNGSYKLKSYKSTTFNNVLFTGSGGVALIQKLTGGAGIFYLSSTGTMTFSGNTKLNVTSGKLTLLSDATSSATITAIPSGCQINGTVNVQRYISDDRGWRFLSSPVYTSTDSYGNYIYSIKYLQNSIYISGPTGALTGFDWAGNSSLFLYREDNIPDYGSFGDTNFRSITGLLTDPYYQVGLESGNFSIPVANGYQVFIRCDRALITDIATAKLATTHTAVTLTASGTINQQAVTFKSWHSPTSSNLSYSNQDAGLLGFNLVGNPYPSAIDWDKLNNTNGDISGTNVSISIYSYNAANKNYAVYQSGTGGTGPNGGSNIIGSGQGFFVVATSANATLTFNESAKTSTTYTGVASGVNILSKQPITAAVLSLMRLKIALDSVNTDETMILFDKNAKSAFDRNEDARYLAGGGKVSLSSLSQDSVAIAINHLPLKSGQPVRLNVNSSVSGTFMLSLEDLRGIPKMYDIWLKDNFAGDSVNLRITNTYSFTIDRSNPATFGKNRFAIIVKQDTAYAYKLLSFNAARVGNSSHVETHWTTANEENYTNFTVERSTDGGNTFTVVGGLWGTGAGAYSLVDKDAVTGTNLYRLKSEDINNTVTYSNIATVVISENGNNNADKIHLYPNPTSSIVNMDVLDKTNGNISYKITVSNSTGFIVKQVTSSQPNWQADVSALLPGTYLIRVINSKTQDFIGESKLIKL